MRSDIERYLAGRPVQAPLVPPVAATPPPAAPTAVSAAPVPPYEEEEPRSRTGLIVALGLLLVVLIAGGAYLLPGLFEKAPDQVPSPNVINQTEQQARQLIGDAGLAVGTIDRENSSDVATGRVIRQDPTPDEYVDPDTAVDLVISLGKPQVEVPFVIGQDRKDAKVALEAQGFKVELKQEESDEDQNTVTRTQPSQGTTVAEGTTIVVYYSDGREKVPNLVGKQQAEAENAVRNAGFEPRVIQSADTTKPAGTVIDQSPRAGETPSKGSTVTIVVSSFVAPPPTPSGTPTPTGTPNVNPTATPTLPPPA
jgi:beta-lactam-binding protein with PASTA domain